MVICDTNILIEVFKGNESLIDFLERIGNENLAVSDVTRGELYFGARNNRELKLIIKELKNFSILPINSEISNIAISLMEKHTLSHNLALPDALIAATAISNKLKLFTLNLKDFKYLESINLVEWKK